MRNLSLTFLIAALSYTVCDAQFWQPVSVPFSPTGSVTGLVITPQDYIFTGSWGSGVYRSNDNGDTWTTTNVGLNRLFISSLVQNRNGVFFLTNDGSVFRSVDTCHNWVEVPTGLLNTYSNTLAADTGNLVYLGNALGLYHSYDLGDHWLHDSSFVMTPNNSISCIAITAAHGILLGTVDGIYLSTDHGQTWQHKVTSQNIASITMKPDGTLFAGSCDNGPEKGDGILRSTDNGNIWTGICSGIADSAVWTVYPFAGDELFAGSYHRGVFHSIDNGNNWDSLSAGLSNLNVSRFAKTKTGYLYAGTNNRLSRSVRSLTGIHDLRSVDAGEMLQQNEPNPFAANTKIQYTLPEGDGGRVTLQVYDMLGRRVATLVDSDQSAGNYIVDFTPSVRIPAGVYVYEINYHGHAEKKQMICAY